MKACLSTKVYDLSGFVWLDNIDESQSKAREHTRRLTRQATLDTGAYIDDRGYSAGDRTILLAIIGDQVLYESLLYLTQNYSNLWICLPDGAFTGNIKTLDSYSGRIWLTVLLSETA